MANDTKNDTKYQIPDDIPYVRFNFSIALRLVRCSFLEKNGPRVLRAHKLTELLHNPCWKL